MAAGVNSHLQKFRQTFVKANLEQKIASWYPGHMFKGMLQMQAKLATVDCIIEVHDARIPFSGRNPEFYTRLTAIRPHILVLNKMDLSDMSYRQSITERLKRERIENILFTNCKENSAGEVCKIVPMAIDLIRSSEHVNLAFKSEFRMMVIGIPNVGKSSLINRLRHTRLHRRKATAVGAKPGVTKSVLERVKVNENPPIYLLDTPGVMQPKIRNIEVGMRLALCCTLKDSVVGEELIADYLLYWLNKHENFSYVKYLNISEPVDDVRLLLFQISRIRNMTLKIRNAEGSLVNAPNLKEAAIYFISAFRKGAFGKLLLDDDIVNKNSK